MQPIGEYADRVLAGISAGGATVTWTGVEVALSIVSALVAIVAGGLAIAISIRKLRGKK